MASPNAKTREETQAEGAETFGVLNQHPTSDDEDNTSGPAPAFRVGVSVDKNKKCRRTMEDAHSFIYDFGGIRGQGYFAVFDGHAGKHAAEWCGEHFHEHLLESLLLSPSTPIPDLFNTTFHLVDRRLSELAAADGTHSGCTAVTAFLRLEDADGNAVGTAGGVGSAVAVKKRSTEGLEEGAPLAAGTSSSSNTEPTLTGEEKTEPVLGAELTRSPASEAPATTAGSARSMTADDLIGGGGGGGDEDKKRMFGDGVTRGKIKDFLTKATSSSKSGVAGSGSIGGSEADGSEAETSGMRTPLVEINGPAEVKKAAKRTLYTANVGDARAVLSRGGRAVRLTYDHKGSDAQEAKRITDAGGFVMNNRVNGILAVTRSLGDSSMKEFVVGSPYTTETTLGPKDEFLIVACDGLWDVCEDQQAVDIIKDLRDPQEASRALLDHALQNFSSDNLSVLVVSLRP